MLEVLRLTGSGVDAEADFDVIVLSCALVLLLRQRSRWWLNIESEVSLKRRSHVGHITLARD